MSLLSVADAQARLLALATPLAPVTLPLVDAVGRWVTHDIVALRSQPSLPLSAMDGYAIRFAELPGPWTVVGESAAGGGLGRALAPGEAARIFTGAPMPDGADTVLVQEEAARDGATLMLSGEGPCQRTKHVRPAGSDFRAGEVLVNAGERLTAGCVGLVACGGHAAAEVRTRPRAGILSTGDELVGLGTSVDGARLPASNGPMLAALLAGGPAEVHDLGIVGDRMDALTDAFRAAADTVDILVTIGGASVGDHDLVRPALQAAGAEIDFWRVALRPGKPLMAGRLGDTIVLGLPGNPVSSFVTAMLFLLPLIARLSGARDPLPVMRAAALGAALGRSGSRAEYLRGYTREGLIFPADDQGSAALRGLARADLLIVRHAGAPPAPAGTLVETIAFR